MSLLLWLVLTSVPHAANAQVPAWVQSTNAVEFFTNLSSRLLSADGYPFDANSIPVYTNGTFVFSPDVRRILQVAANIYDATTSHHATPGDADLPTVLRPTFRRQVDGPYTNIYIGGFTEVGAVTGSNDPQFAMPLDLNDATDRAAAGTVPDQNIYDVPWIIGVKKGFPSFNEFAMQSVAQITRKLQLRRPTVLSRPNATNQLFVIGISNVFAFEAWNGYPTSYARAVQIVAVNDMTIGFAFTNDLALDLRGSSVAIRLSLGVVTNIGPDAWSGYGSRLLAPARASFAVPLLTNITFLPDSYFRTESAFAFATNMNVGAGLINGFEQTGRFLLPQFNYAVSNRIRFILIDTASGRVIDYIQLSGLNGVRDLSSELVDSPAMVVDNNNQSLGSEAMFFRTNRIGGGTLSNPPEGVLNQINASLGFINIRDWRSFGVGQASGASKQKEIDLFRVFCGLIPLYNQGTVNTNLVTTVPFTPTRKTSQYLTWQANDPLVHFTRQDLWSAPLGNGILRENPNGPLQPLRNIGALNDRFEPWGGKPNAHSFISPSTVPAFGSAYKDPGVRSAEDWGFTANGPLSIACIGKVHRGTPWQTFYLKSGGVASPTWRKWLGGWDADSALRAEPVNDRPLIDALLRLLNTENPNHLLSVNTSHANQWRRVLNRTSVLSNSSSDAELNSNPPVVRFETNTMRAGGKQTEAIIAGIVQTRGDQIWQEVSDVLAASELAENSPWLNVSSATQLQLGITDEAYEKIASQLLPRLRADSKGSAHMAADGYAVEFTGYDGSTYAIETSSDLVHWDRIAESIPTNGVIRFISPKTAEAGNQFYRSRLLP